MKKMVCVLGVVVAAVASASAQENFPKDSAATIDAIPFETRTISDDAFRAGDKSAGVSTEIAGAHLAYSAEATAATEKAVLDLLGSVFKLK